MLNKQARPPFGPRPVATLSRKIMERVYNKRCCTVAAAGVIFTAASIAAPIAASSATLPIEQ